MPDSPDMSASSPRVQVELTLGYSPRLSRLAQQVHPAHDGMSPWFIQLKIRRARRFIPLEAGRAGRFIQLRVTWMEET
jgi:hypothetical protein